MKEFDTKKLLKKLKDNPSLNYQQLNEIMLNLITQLKF